MGRAGATADSLPRRDSPGGKPAPEPQRRHAMLSFHAHLKVFVATASCDLRLSFNELWAAVQTQLGEDPKQGALFVFGKALRDCLHAVAGDSEVERPGNVEVVVLQVSLHQDNRSGSQALRNSLALSTYLLWTLTV